MYIHVRIYICTYIVHVHVGILHGLGGGLTSMYIHVGYLQPRKLWFADILMYIHVHVCTGVSVHCTC